MTKGIQENIDDYSSNKVFDMFLDFVDTCKRIWNGCKPKSFI